MLVKRIDLAILKTIIIIIIIIIIPHLSNQCCVMSSSNSLHGVEHIPVLRN